MKFSKPAFWFVFIINFLIGLLGAFWVFSTEGDFLKAIIPLLAFIGFGLFEGYIVGLANFEKKHSTPHDMSKYKEYLEENKTSLGLFARPVIGKSKIILANKFVIIEIDISNATDNVFILDITDKIKKVKHKIKVNSSRTYKSYRSFKKLISNIIDYDTTADDIPFTLNRANTEYSEIQISDIKDTLFLDINQASEAELTALPGVTIAKAKHAIKMRKKYAFYLTMNQFYEAINLEEEFIEQIQSRGTKVILNELPEYKKLEMGGEE